MFFLFILAPFGFGVGHCRWVKRVILEKTLPLTQLSKFLLIKVHSLNFISVSFPLFRQPAAANLAAIFILHMYLEAIERFHEEANLSDWTDFK